MSRFGPNRPPFWEMKRGGGPITKIMKDRTRLKKITELQDKLIQLHGNGNRWIHFIRGQP